MRPTNLSSSRGRAQSIRRGSPFNGQTDRLEAEANSDHHVTATVLESPFLQATERWLQDFERHARVIAPDLGDVLNDYIGEAHFGAEIIDAEMSQLPRGARVLEVGAGMLLLSCALRSAGYHVSAVEPVGIGFSHIDRLRELVWNYAADRGCCPEVRPIKAEQLVADAEFDFAFSMNVMEHVDDVPVVLRRVLSALRPGATYRFVCPNYRFPYEPHFGMPTLFSKALTGRVLRTRILESRTVIDPDGTWQSLNWISVASVRRTCRHLGVEPEFDRAISSRYVRRVIGDPSFQRRHSGAIAVLGASLDAIGVTRLLTLLPAGTQPAMSCRITRPRVSHT